MKAPRLLNGVPYSDEIVEFCGKWFKCFVAGTPTHVPGEEYTQHPDDASSWGGGIVLVGAFGLLATDQLDRRRKRKQKAAAGMGDGQPDEWFADDEVDPDGDDLGQSHQLSTTTPDSDLYDVLAASHVETVRAMRCNDSDAVTPAAEMDNRGLGRGEQPQKPQGPRRRSIDSGAGHRATCLASSERFPTIRQSQQGWSWRSIGVLGLLASLLAAGWFGSGDAHRPTITGHPATRPIETIRVGDRVLVDAPQAALNADPSYGGKLDLEPIDPEKYRLVRLAGGGSLARWHAGCHSR